MREAAAAVAVKKGLVDKWVSIVKGEKPNSQKIPNVLTLEHSIRREPRNDVVAAKTPTREVCRWKPHKSLLRSSETSRSFPEQHITAEQHS